jgi:hypothetical protein
LGVRVSRRRNVVAASGRRFSVCGTLQQAQGDPRGQRTVAPAATTVSFAWISGVTLLVVVALSVYAVARPPEFPDTGNRPAISAVARYSLADFFSGAR